jgi:hypothetical protein
VNHFLLFIGVVMVAETPAAWSAHPCASHEARAFDFWIGDWSIEQKILQQDGSWLKLGATTSVSRDLDGCAIVEHWDGSVQFFWEGMKGPERMKGLSVRAYDPRTGKWYIHWMDTRRSYFGNPYAGGFNQGRGEFFREWETPQGKRTGRIVFSDITDTSVHWELAISSDERATWTTLWVMEMHRSGK